ncbi:hypothetical protein [Spirosoma sp.]|uniref:hypothetical protein n=1 Tax=Spirosoma sp. TaxID=1899569 RepID=UPI003B3B09B2
MKLKHSFSLVALGMALATTSVLAQTTPTGTATSTTYPQGAIAPDSMPMKASREQKKAMRQNRKSNRKNTGSTTNTSVQDARYRESSASDGTSINNSNTTNYNSNNVTNAPTGAGSNPNTVNTPATTSTPQKPNK